MENYDKNKESSYLVYLDANNLFGWTMSEKLPVGCFKWKKTFINFMKNYGEDNDKGYILKVDVEYPKNLLNVHGDLSVLAERMKIKKKCNKLVFNINAKENYVVQIRALKQALNHGRILKKVHRVIQLNQEDWLKSVLT